MTDRSIDELGPVDYLVVEFPAGQQNFTGEAADELLRLHDAGIIRIMDIVVSPSVRVVVVGLNCRFRAPSAPRRAGSVRGDAARRGPGAGRRERRGLFGHRDQRQRRVGFRSAAGLLSSRGFRTAGRRKTGESAHP